jgi:dolichol-phosphate mannosyltransferase
MLEHWRKGAQLVLGIRGQRPGETGVTIWLSRLFRWLLRSIGQLSADEASGGGFFLMDRRVVDAFLQFPERNANVLALTAWMGFRQARIDYDQPARLYGRSGWTLKKKLKLAADSITGFSNLPLQLTWGLGVLFSIAGATVAVVAAAGKFRSVVAVIWAAAVAVGLLVGGSLMLVMGVLGEYLWRALDESRRRPRYLIEATVGVEPRLPV